MELFPGTFLEETAKSEPIVAEQEVHEETVDYAQIARDEKSELLLHLKKMTQTVNDAHLKICELKKKVRVDGSSGISLLMVRNLCMAEYIDSIAKFSLSKATGQDPASAISDLVAERCFVEKIKPLEKQMKFQIERYDEMLRGSTGVLRAKPETMLQEESAESVNMTNAQYHAPKIAPALYPGAAGEKERESRYAKSRKASARQMELVEENMEEFQDDPIEAGKRQASREYRAFLSKQKEIEQFEEENFTRVQSSKKDRAMMKRLQQIQGSMESIIDYKGNGKPHKNRKNKPTSKNSKRK